MASPGCASISDPTKQMKKMFAIVKDSTAWLQHTCHHVNLPTMLPQRSMRPLLTFPIDQAEACAC